MLEQSAALDAHLRALIEDQRAGRYSIEWQELHFRRSGTLRWPVAVCISDIDRLAEWLGFEADLNTFRWITATAAQRLPDALGWLANEPWRALKSADAFERMLGIAQRLRTRPRPGCHVREIDVAGVDSKFIEHHHAALGSLLDQVLPASAIEPSRRASGPAGFARRFGFAFAPARVRLRLLDPTLAPIAALRDIELPLADLAQWPIPCARVFITENKISGLSFPPVKQSIVLFGMGHALRQLESVAWLADKDIHYWGDIDTHGFAMLSALRRRFPQTCSLLMDRHTLFAHREWWGQEGSGQRWLQPLAHLDADEAEVYAGLLDDRWAESLRLEQERILYSHACAAIAALPPPL